MLWLGLPSGSVPPSETDDDVEPLALPLTSYPGQEFSPALSPDAHQLAFIRSVIFGISDLYPDRTESDIILLENAYRAEE